MPPLICETCGCHYYSEEDTPQEACPICEDDRQWVPATGQRWTTLDKLRSEGFVSEVRAVEPGLTGIGASRMIGIGQRGLLLDTGAGNVLWDPSPFLDDAAIQAVRDAGGLRAVSASHPH
ncbi:MAG: hypothetical protein ACJ786_06135, partial [Catenulispora sp.]